MNNLVLHITLPQGIRLQNGQTLMTDLTYDLISSLTPYYASVDQVRLVAGPPLRKLSDITIACQIYMASKQTDTITPLHVPRSGPRATRFLEVRNLYVASLAAKEQLLNMVNLLGPNAHVLANFSVDRKADLTKNLNDITAQLAMLEVSIRSGGRTMPGGRPMFEMAAKGVMDFAEVTPGRTWFGNGYGANAKTADYGSPTGGRGKPMSFSSEPAMFGGSYGWGACSPPFSMMRMGAFSSGYPLLMGGGRPFLGGF